MTPPPSFSGAPEGSTSTLEPRDLARLLDEQADFVWRSLRRLGVPESGVDDATQQVFLVAQQRITSIVAGRERAFLFTVAMNVAAHVRRTLARRRELGSEPLGALVDPAPLADAQLERSRARALLDEVLDAMSVDLRTVFVLYELEEMSMAEIAEVVSIPQGTVASRLRRAREEFHEKAQRVRARSFGPGSASVPSVRVAGAPAVGGPR